MSIETLWLVLGLAILAGLLLTYAYVVAHRVWSAVTGIASLITMVAIAAAIAHGVFG